MVGRVWGRATSRWLVGTALIVVAVQSSGGMGVGPAEAETAPQGDDGRGVTASSASPTGEASETPTAAVPQDPRGGLDLSRLVVEQGRLVQHVGDRTIVTTLDPGLQRFAQQLLERYEVPEGAAVAINSRTGEVLALAEHSEREPGRHTALIADSPAASIFKVVTAAALLELAGIPADTEVCYHGGTSGIAASLLVPDPERDRRCASLSSALGRSLNVVFARLADQNLSQAQLSEYVRGFGFNRPLGFDLPLAQARAEVPHERLERARMAAGFWHTYISPMHAALIAQAVAQQGALLQPYLVDEVQGPGGEILYDGQPQYLGRACSPETARQLARMMVLTTTVGTARSSFRQDGRPVIPGVDVAGKTGTLHGRDPFRAYDWFMGFAPADRPEIAVAGLVVNDLRWRIKGHFVAREVLREYFERERSPVAAQPAAPSQ